MLKLSTFLSTYLKAKQIIFWLAYFPVRHVGNTSSTLSIIRVTIVLSPINLDHCLFAGLESVAHPEHLPERCTYSQASVPDSYPEAPTPQLLSSSDPAQFIYLFMLYSDHSIILLSFFFPSPPLLSPSQIVSADSIVKRIFPEGGLSLEHRFSWLLNNHFQVCFPMQAYLQIKIDFIFILRIFTFSKQCDIWEVSMQQKLILSPENVVLLINTWEICNSTKFKDKELNIQKKLSTNSV